MNNHLIKTIVALTIIFSVAACDSMSKTPTTYDAESYTYKGAADPLMSVSEAERAGPLGERFDLIQGRK